MGDFIISLTKLILAILLIPVAVAFVIALNGHMDAYPLGYARQFLNGEFVFLLVFLFLYQFGAFFTMGQKIVEGMFRIISPVDKIIARMLPFYLSVTLVVFYIARVAARVDNFDKFFMFSAGFLFALHIILTAQDMQAAETAPVKPTYLFTINWVVIFSSCIAVLLLDLTMGRFEFVPYIKYVMILSKKYFAFFFGMMLS